MLFRKMVTTFGKSQDSLFIEVHKDKRAMIAKSKDRDICSLPISFHVSNNSLWILSTVKILKIGTPEIITIIVLQLEQLDFTVQYCVQKMQTE